MAATITAHIPRVHLAEHPRPPDSTRLPPRPRRPRSAARVTCKKSAADQSAAAFEAKKSVHVDYDEGRHEVWTRVSGLRKKDIPMRYRIRVEGDRFQKDWTVSVVVEKVMEIKHWEDVHGVLNRWVGRFARKNFPLLIKVSS